ncbi:hypothetical protein [Sphingomonas abaci]|uniref:Uncharacterized protein n=1 Tax=Sphingomonas abaci TaxID=237611 RepID=A0A7W7EWT7_9SPHN|nr:hypothetical protein [Sphingomonas abaci]MBB4616426.1 hypothetical protein [Sphingomonas abaci]
MYDLIDRPVADLPRFEQVVLAETRRWVHALTLAGSAPATPSGFADHGGAPAARSFDALMRDFDQGSTDTLVFERPCHSTVSETEAVVLGLWRLVRADRIATARAAAAGLVDEASARRIIAAMVRVVGLGFVALD